MNSWRAAMIIADEIFDAPAAPFDRVQRIAFKGGHYPDRETDLGGLNKDALIRIVESALRKAEPALRQETRLAPRATGTPNE